MIRLRRVDERLEVALKTGSGQQKIRGIRKGSYWRGEPR